MKTFFTSFLLTAVLFLGKTSACDCIFIEDFCQTVTFQNNGEIHDYLNIYHVQVTAQASDGMKVKIFKTFHGEMLTGAEIFITSGNGADCQLITSQFQVGKEMVIAAGKATDTDLWWISECGVSWLPVENGIVSGAIAEGVTQIALAEFSSLGNCGSLTSVVASGPELSISVQPTLAANEVSIATTTDTPSDLRVAVFDISGRVVYQAASAGFSSAQPFRVSVDAWSAGVYFIKITSEGREGIFKVVKV